MLDGGQTTRTVWKHRARAVAVVLASAVLLVVLEFTGWRVGSDRAVLFLVERLVASIIIGSMSGILVLYAAPIFFPSEIDEETRILHAEYPPEDRLLTFNRLYIEIRWFLAGGVLVLAALALHQAGYDVEAPVRALVALAVLVLAANGVFLLLLWRRCHPLALAESQVFFDILAVLVALHYSGGIENPVAFAYSIIVVMAGVLLDRVRCFVVAGVACLALTAVAIGEMTGLVAHSSFHLVPLGQATGHGAFLPEMVFPTLGMHLLLLCCIAYLTTAVMERLRTEERHGLAVRQRSELIMKTTGIGFAIWDREGAPDWLNTQMQEWLEVNPKSPWPDLSYWTGGKNGDIEKTYLDGRVRTGERNRIDSNGEVQIYYVVTMPVIDHHGQIFEVVELVQRITERKRQASELARSSQLATLGVMAAGIAHEVNNPLASISTRLRLLEEDHTPEFRNESIKLLQGQVLRIAQIVRSVTQFARPAREERTRCDLNTVVSETLNLLQLHDRRALCRIETRLARQLPPVNVNASQLQQVFLNLGLNAFEAMSGGGKLTVSTRVEEGSVCTVFEDTGCGVPEQDQARIFNAFYSTKSRGLGLGLTVVHDIVKSHGGRIEITNSAKGGAVFRVTLPAVWDDPAEHEVVAL